MMTGAQRLWELYVAQCHSHQWREPSAAYPIVTLGVWDVDSNTYIPPTQKWYRCRACATCDAMDIFEVDRGSAIQ